ncbi:MAG: phospho-N-acetylmuramoyl-pentapeptide-transferase [Oscillospiraceae bacterium]|jgi:phospho-N-acetylmuramoyl-pentapeptide-transferase|nr:phospho-N-acetylmuramoyl-pentapeptide-transferase [Oscillospiraceae bacterium]
MNEWAALIIAVVTSFGITWLLGYKIIPWLHKLKFGQVILDIGPNWHKHKQGTPTMGGIMFIVGTLLSCLLVFGVDALFYESSLLNIGHGFGTKLLSGILMASLFGLIGFLDDYTKVVKKRNKGLSISQKTVTQVVVAVGYLFSLYLAMGKDPYTFIPFVFGKVHLGWFFWVFGLVILYAAINAVNFTDGIDGLCSSVTITAAAAVLVCALLLKLPGVGIAAAALGGGCAGFLVWNKNPAKVFMGDTGSMFLGGMLVALCFALDVPVVLLLVGVIYVIEGLSDVIQIGYFKATHGKRVFKMAPIHHHFEMSGWNENKIVAVFSAVNILGGLCGIAAIAWGLAENYPLLINS